MSWLLVFIGFSLLIVLHEGGHYVAAKATGMRVERFFLFFGPTIWSFKRGETEYGIKSIPIGGYVKITGMNPEEEVPPEHEDRAYHRQPVWKRIVAVAAGPAVNIVLAFAVLLAVFTVFSAEEATQSVARVVPKSAAAGVLERGDRIVAVDGSRYLRLDPKDRVDKFRGEIGSHRCAGKQKDGCVAASAVVLTVERGGRIVALSVRPRYDAAAGQTLVGFEFDARSVSLSGGEALDRATGAIWSVATGTVHVFTHLFESEQRKQISGVVGISDVAHETIDSGERSLERSLLLLALVSLSLGLVNLLPILPLDGGHIFWALVEKLRRGRPVSLRVMERATVVGIALFLMLFFLGLSNDIGRITGEGFNVR
jgi:regulator of sigma E protease